MACTGRIIGQAMAGLARPEITPLPVGLVPKPHSDKWRLIIDLSYPRGKSVNDNISSAFCSLQYTSVDNAVDIITALGNSTELIKLDLSNAYRIVPVHPDDQPLLGLSWQGSTYMDRALPFRAKISTQDLQCCCRFFSVGSAL